MGEPVPAQAHTQTPFLWKQAMEYNTLHVSIILEHWIETDLLSREDILPEGTTVLSADPTQILQQRRYITNHVLTHPTEVSRFKTIVVVHLEENSRITVLNSICMLFSGGSQRFKSWFSV